MSFINKLKENHLFFDGSMGSLLIQKGIKSEGDPSLLNITNPEAIKEIHRTYAASGSDFVTTNTFGANRYKLDGSGYTVEQIVSRGVELAKEATPNAYVALDLGPTGKLLRPMGQLTFDEAYDVFKEQVEAGARAGADLVIIETMSDLLEAKVALLAVKENSSLPVVVTMTFQENGRTLSGSPAEVVALTLEANGADAVGINCSTGPDKMLPLVEAMRSVLTVPILVQPNAGLPRHIEGSVAYDLSVEDYVIQMTTLAESGAHILGGCCGTTPEYIKALKSSIEGRTPNVIKTERTAAVCSSTEMVWFDKFPITIGERINPAGKALLKKSFQEGRIDLAVKEAFDQVEAGADIIDVNVSGRGVDETAIYEELITTLNGTLSAPLQIDNVKGAVVERACRIYAGVPIINSVNGKESSMDSILPIAKKYGAMLIGLALDGDGIPETVKDRIEVVERIINEAKKYNIDKSRFLVDCLTLSAASNRDSYKVTLDAMDHVKNVLGIKTTLGASNVSYGLPNRDLVNGSFLSMAFAKGLDAPITDPLQPEVKKAIDIFAFLEDNEKVGRTYLETYGNAESTTVTAAKFEGDLKGAIQKGFRTEAMEKTKAYLEKESPQDIVDKHLIPALERVGEDYDKGKIYLPQLLSSAEAAKGAFEVVKIAIEKDSVELEEKLPVVLATVEGDVHDIGKNIVAVMLENFGYDVIDLGKNVPTDAILNAVKQHGVKLVGLSALMTTTVESMEKSITALREYYPDVQVMVGGAVLTQDYANDIGAHAYGRDARDAVRIADRILKGIK